MLSTVLVAALGAGFAQAEAPVDLPQVEPPKPPVMKIEAVGKATDAFRKNLKALKARYEKYLVAIEAAEKKKGNLDAIEAIAAERGRLSDEYFFASKTALTGDALKARDSYNASVNNAQGPYIQQLQAIQIQLVQKNQLEEARLVRNWIDDLQGKSIVGIWVKPDTGTEFTFKADGSVEAPRAVAKVYKSGQWTKTGDTIKIEYPGETIVLKASDKDKDMLTGAWTLKRRGEK